MLQRPCKANSGIQVFQAVKVPVIASGGIRTGIDIAKTLSLGAAMASIAHPFLVAAAQSPDAVYAKIQELKREIQTAIFLTGARNIRELRSKPLIITGRTREWLEMRGIDTRAFARR